MTFDDIISCKDPYVHNRFFCSLLKSLGKSRINQQDIAERMGISPALLSTWKKPENTKPLIPVLKEIVNLYDITIDDYNEDEDCISNFQAKKQKVSEANIKIPRVFLQNSTWLIYVELLDKNNKAECVIGVRILKIYEDGKVEYILNSDEHEDYEGLYSASDKPVIVLDLTTKTYKKKDLRIYLWINEMSSNPSVMSGIMTYYRIDRGIDSYRILAFPNSQKVPKVELFKKEELSKKQPEIVDYFNLTGPNKLYSTPDISDSSSLKSYLITKKSEQDFRIKAELIQKIKNCKDSEALKKIAFFINNFNI